MDRYAVIGHPVEHSRSPDIQARFAAQTGQSIDYTRLLSPLDGFPATVRQFAADGAHGCNVTVPFKFKPGNSPHAARRAPSAPRPPTRCASMPKAGGATTPTASGWCATSRSTPASRWRAGACC